MIRFRSRSSKINLRSERVSFLIDNTPGYRSAGCFGSMEEALPAMTGRQGDIVLMDLGLPGMNGVEGIRRLKQTYPELNLVALTVYEDDDRIFNGPCAGASGYLLKKTPPARLLECLQEVMTGGAPCRPKSRAV